MIPLVRRFPALARLPRASLGRFPTPVVQASALAPSLWVKRDDLSAEPLGGNKVRALEFLLGGVGTGEQVVTVGARGSTHALAVAIYAKRLGARVAIAQWPQEMNAAARVVADHVEREAAMVRRFRSPVTAYLWSWTRRLRGARWIPAGGSSALGVLGHVNAALELATQLQAGEAPVPRQVIVPLGTGGTAAGLTLGFAIAGVTTVVVGARVVPRIVARRARVRALIADAARLIERQTGERLPRPRARSFRIAHDVFGGAYGRETARAREAAERFSAWSGFALDTTYGAKACAVALGSGDGGPCLFWLTFDSRILTAP